MSDYLQSILEPCARAGHEAQRAFDVARGEEPEPEWGALTPEAQGDVISSAASVLRGEGPAADHEVWAYLEREAGRATPRYRELPEWVHRRDMAFKQAVATASAAATALPKPKKTSAKSAKGT